MTPRELTVYHLAKHSPFSPGEITQLLRLAATHRRLCTMQCNGEGSTRRQVPSPGLNEIYWTTLEEWGADDDAKMARVERRIQEICEFASPGTPRATVNQMRPLFQHDPRGSTVKIAVPDGFTDDWGQEGICL